MLYFILLFQIIFTLSCKQSSQETKIDKSNIIINDADDTQKKEVATKFINQYIALLTNNADNVEIENWLNNNEMVTDDYRKVYKRILDEANKEDAEYGLGADAILDAQDYPDDGFVASKVENNYVYLKGKTVKQFEVKVKLLKKEETWKVDGSGIINME